MLEGGLVRADLVGKGYRKSFMSMVGMPNLQPYCFLLLHKRELEIWYFSKFLEVRNSENLAASQA